MDISFEDSKFLFYTQIRKENPQKEEDIRKLVDDIILYIRHINQANYLPFKQKEQEIIEFNFFKEKQKEIKKENNPKLKEAFKIVNQYLENKKDFYEKIFLEFEDIQEIASYVAISENKKINFKKIFSKNSPLEKRIQELNNHLNLFRKTGKLRFDYLNEKIISNVSLATNYFKTNSNRYKDIFEKCFDYYLEKKENLEKLSNSRERIHRYYSGNNFNERKLFWTQTKRLAKYFKQQAQINGIRFETLHFSQSIIEDSSRENLSPQIYKNFMNSLEES